MVRRDGPATFIVTAVLVPSEIVLLPARAKEFTFNLTGVEVPSVELITMFVVPDTVTLPQERAVKGLLLVIVMVDPDGTHVSGKMIPNPAHEAELMLSDVCGGGGLGAAGVG